MTVKPEIKTYDFEWQFSGNPQIRSNTEELIYHHTYAPRDIPIQEVDRWHKERGWAGIGYHFYITGDGVIHQGRELEWVGVHTAGRNNVSIGICFAGNLDKHKLTKEQLEAGAKLTKWLMDEYPGVRLGLHNEYANKSCPGNNFSLDELKEAVENVSDLPEIQRKVNGTVLGERVDSGYIIENRTFVPIRVIAEQLGYRVDWDSEKGEYIVRE